MKLHKNEVTLDTCGCKFQQSVDRDDPTDVMSFDHFIQKCPVHAQILDDEAWKLVWLNDNSEQHRKNGLYRALTVEDPTGLGAGLVENIPAQRRKFNATFGRDLAEFDAQGQPVMEDHYDVIGGSLCYAWAFDENRCLCICIDGVHMDAVDKQRVQDYCDARFGPDQVRVRNSNEG